MTHCAGISRFTLKTSRTKRRAACRVSVGMVDGSIWSANWMAMSLRRTSEDLSASRASVQTSRMNRFRCFTREYASKWSRTKGVLPHRDLLTCYSPRASVMAGKKWQRKWQRSLESQETLGKWSFPKAMALWGSQVRTLSAPPLQKKCSGRKAGFSKQPSRSFTALFRSLPLASSIHDVTATWLCTLLRPEHFPQTLARMNT